MSSSLIVPPFLRSGSTIIPRNIGDVLDITGVNSAATVANTIGTTGFTTFFGDGSNLTGIGGAATLQTAYTAGQDILTASSVPFQVRDNGIALGATSIFPGYYGDISSAGLAFGMINDGTTGLPGIAGGQQVILDTAVTFPAVNQIEFGVNLRTTGGGVISPAAATGAGSNVINGCIVNLKSTDITPTDEGEYIITGFANGLATDSIAIVTNFAGGSPGFTATSGTAKIFKQTLGLNTNPNASGTKNIFISVDEGDGTGILVGTFNDGGNYDSMQSLFNIGDLTSGMFNLINGGATFGHTADVPYIRMGHLGVAPDAVDIEWVVRTAPPTTPTIGGMWYDSTGVDRWYGETPAGTESFAFLSDLSTTGTLDDAYDFGGAGAGRIITADSGAVQINAPVVGDAFVVRDTTGGGVTAFSVSANGNIFNNHQATTGEALTINNAGANNLAHIRFAGTSVAPTTPTSGSFWFDSTLDRLGVELSTGSEDLAFFSDITLDDAYNGGSTITADAGAVTFTVPNTGNNQAIVINQNDSTNNPDAILINNAGTGNDIVGSNFQVSKAGEVDGSGFAVAGTPGLTSTYTFGGGGSGDIASMTFDGGILTGVTLVP